MQKEKNIYLPSCKGCTYYKGKTRILIFSRKSYKNVNYLVVTQQPGFKYKDDNYKNIVQSCISGNNNRESTPMALLHTMFGCFDPTGGNKNVRTDLYWTHAIKCFPSSTDKEIRRKWPDCCLNCSKYFLEEYKILNKSRNNQLAIITMGKYALTVVLNSILNNGTERNIKKLIIPDWDGSFTNYLYQSKGKVIINNIIIYPLFHPGYLIFKGQKAKEKIYQGKVVNTIKQKDKQ